MNTVTIMPSFSVRPALVLALALLAGVRCTPPEPEEAAPPDPFVMTVRGPVAPDRLGPTLSHEHVLVDFAGVAEVSPDRYERAEVFRVVRPYLDQARSAGAQTFIDATPAYLGRDPRLLRQLADSTGLHVIASTGYYGAREDQHLPPHTFTDTPDELAARWTEEWETGIDDSGIRPGFIKIGVDPGPLSDIDRKLVRAAARTHLRTGLTIASHTGPVAGAVDQLAILDEEGVDPSAWIWVHAQAEPDSTQLIEAARRGTWISFDGLSADNVEGYRDRILMMARAGLLDRVLVSHDAGWYAVGEPNGGDFRPYTTLFTDLVPALREGGLSDEAIDGLLVAHPAAAFTVRVRARTAL